MALSTGDNGITAGGVVVGGRTQTHLCGNGPYVTLLVEI